MARGRKIRDAGHYQAIQHIRQRDELSRLVHGIDVEVLAIFFRFDSAVLDRLSTQYRQLFGEKAESYLRETLPAWRTGKTTVSGRNAARLLIVVPLFLNDQQRDALTARLRGIDWDEQVVRWIYGQNSTVRERIKTAAEPRPGVTVPSLPDRFIPSPPRPQFASNVVVTTPPPPSSNEALRLADLPRPSSPANNPSPAPSTQQNQGLGCIVACIVLFVVFAAISSSPTKQRSSSPAAPPADARAAPGWDSSGHAPLTDERKAPPDSLKSPLHLAMQQPSATPLVTPIATPTSLEVKYVRKTNRRNPPVRIVQVGGTNADGTLWALTPEDAIAGIQTGKYALFVPGKDARVAVQVVTGQLGDTVLRTQADGKVTNNLLRLPGFPPVARAVPFARPSPTSAPSVPSGPQDPDVKGAK